MTTLYLLCLFVGTGALVFVLSRRRAREVNGRADQGGAESANEGGTERADDDRRESAAETTPGTTAGTTARRVAPLLAAFFAAFVAGFGGGGYLVETQGLLEVRQGAQRPPSIVIALIGGVIVGAVGLLAARFVQALREGEREV